MNKKAKRVAKKHKVSVERVKSKIRAAKSATKVAKRARTATPTTTKKAAPAPVAAE